MGKDNSRLQLGVWQGEAKPIKSQEKSSLGRQINHEIQINLNQNGLQFLFLLYSPIRIHLILIDSNLSCFLT
jgi:hypothetical protein